MTTHAICAFRKLCTKVQIKVSEIFGMEEL